MRPPWLGNSQESAELEALQTDVMRFVAILGLCLAAIFSLVHSAALEQAAARQSPPQEDSRPAAVQSARIGELAPARHAAPLPQRPPVPPATTSGSEDPAPAAIPAAPSPHPAPPPHPAPAPPADPAAPLPQHAPAPPAPASGSKDPAPGFTLEFASAQALEYLLQSGRVLLYANQGARFWKLDASGRFAQAEAPTSYYDMHRETVPRGLRDRLPATADPAQTTWGVTLPRETAAQIRQLMAGRQGGSLVISRDAAVRPEGMLRQ